MREVLEYFTRNPEAADSLEGIARWRLREETIHRGVDEINEALQWLVAEGFLVEESPQGRSPIFRFNRTKLDEARQFLTIGDAER